MDKCSKLERQIKNEESKLEKSGVKRNREEFEQPATSQMCTIPQVPPHIEKMLKKQQRWSLLRREITALAADIESISNGKEIQDYWLNAAKYIWEFDQEKKVEKCVMGEMANRTRVNQNLLGYLDRLHALGVTGDESSEKKKRGRTEDMTLSGGIEDQQPVTSKSKKQKKSASVAPGANILSKLQPSLVNTEIQTTPVIRDKEGKNPQKPNLRRVGVILIWVLVYAEYMSRVEKNKTKLSEISNERAERFRGVCSRPFCRGEIAEDFKHDHMLYCTKCGVSEVPMPETDVGEFSRNRGTWTIEFDNSCHFPLV